MNGSASGKTSPLGAQPRFARHPTPQAVSEQHDIPSSAARRRELASAVGFDAVRRELEDLLTKR